MNDTGACKQKVEAELEIAHAKVDEFKAKVKKFTAETRIKYAKHLDKLDNGADTSPRSSEGE